MRTCMQVFRLLIAKCTYIYVHCMYTKKGKEEGEGGGGGETEGGIGRNIHKGMAPLNTTAKQLP